MAVRMFKHLRLKSIPTFLLPFKKKNQAWNSTKATTSQSSVQKPMSAKRRFFWIPRPTKFCPDVGTFLSLIGRNMTEHASKFPGWSSLFRLESTELKRLGIEPPRSRRYLLLWREKFRQGNLGAGADFKYVKDGVAYLGIAEVPKDPRLDKNGKIIPSKGTRKIVVNLPLGVTSAEDISPEKFVPVKGYHVRGSHTIVGPYALPVRGGKRAIVTRKEGMWEMKRGRKIDGGERRQAKVRATRRSEEKRRAEEAKDIL